MCVCVCKYAGLVNHSTMLHLIVSLLSLSRGLDPEALMPNNILLITVSRIIDLRASYLFNLLFKYLPYIMMFPGWNQMKSQETPLILETA